MTNAPETIEKVTPGVDLALRARQAPLILRRAIRHPAWALENVRLLWRRTTEARRKLDLSAHRGYVFDEVSAVMRCLEVSRSDYDRAAAAAWAPPPDGAESAGIWDARQSLQRLVDVCVRLTRPATMVETGVARGYTTAVALKAMQDHGRGRLYSIDLPALMFEDLPFLGSAVPSALRDRWTLRLGPSRAVLPKLLDELGEIDIFLHDADHTYRSQLEEYRLAWAHLRPGGLLLSDDVFNMAFLDFAAEAGGAPYLIGIPAANNAIGLMRR